MINLPELFAVWRTIPDASQGNKAIEAAAKLAFRTGELVRSRTQTSADGKRRWQFVHQSSPLAADGDTAAAAEASARETALHTALGTLALWVRTGLARKGLDVPAADLQELLRSGLARLRRNGVSEELESGITEA